MQMQFGKKYNGKEVAWVLLKDPGYFKWMQREGLTSKPEYQFALKLINIFDSKPLINVKCNGECKGKNQATRLSLYQGIYNGGFWFCDECDPYSLGANRGKLNIVKKFNEISSHRQSESLINAFSQAKGVPARKTKNSLKKFFGY